ncbi:hypothetical protein CAP36_12490 [Chitinophagaceae bacterium IBVUCB2]|nr:hypothetical protein CAP36_12490 [Chitinophagaceae bacterium IBVUCB2]
MLRNLDYKKVLEAIIQVNTIDHTDNANFAVLLTNLSASDFDFKKRIVTGNEFYKFIHQKANLRSSLIADDENSVSLDLFLSLFIHFTLKEKIAGCKNHKEVLAQLKADSFYIAQPGLQEELKFSCLAYFLRTTNLEWHQFIAEFNAKNWSEIHLLSSIFPVSFASVADFLNWIAEIVKVQERDLAIGSIGKSISEWILHKPDNGKEVEENLETIANYSFTNRFFSAVLSGLKDKQKKEVSYYTELLVPLINAGNSYTILHAIGFISQNRDIDKLSYFNLLSLKLSSGVLEKKEFIRLCGIYDIHNTEVYGIIDPMIESQDENKEEIYVVIEFLQREPAQLDKEWFAKATHLIFSKNQPEYKQSLNYLLTLIAEFNLPFAYDLFTFRLQIMGGNELLEDALVEMIRKDYPMFQTRFIGWLAIDDKWVHNSILHITSLTALDKSLFSFKPEVYESLTDKESLFVAYKIVGHVYSMEILQSLLLSLIKSIKKENEVLKEGLYFILSEYLIYNYRSTLDLIKKDIEDKQLLPFAKDIFEKVTGYYENYFTQLRSIVVAKEIRPYKDHSQLHNFYYRKLFADIPKKAEKNSLMSLFKSTQVNANNWAIRRANELKHVPSPLGHISVTSEFPSGEKLNPIYQEFIRRTYQKIEKDEINID